MLSTDTLLIVSCCAKQFSNVTHKKFSSSF